MADFGVLPPPLAAEDIGHDHKIIHMTSRDDDVTYGILLWHNRPGGGPCYSSGGSILFDIPQNVHVPDTSVWQVEHENPLSLNPSLRCPECGDHGWIIDGRWAPA